MAKFQVFDRSALWAFLSTSLLCASVGMSAYAEVADAKPKHPSNGIIVAPMKPEEPMGYPGNPSKLKTPLRQDLTKATFSALPDGHYDLVLGEGESSVSLKDVDLRPFAPRIPDLAKGNKVLTELALMQREFNRNQTTYNNGSIDIQIANNCLRAGLWEVGIIEKDPTTGSSLMSFHGWLDLPKELRAKLFKGVNDVDLAPYEKILEEYPNMDGFIVPLDKLRNVVSENTGSVKTLLDEKVTFLPEQQRKAKLLLTSNVATYRDFVNPQNQPVQTASFSEPGFYNSQKPTHFDLKWLEKPLGFTTRNVTAVNDGAKMTEVEVTFANGYRLLMADETLSSLPALTAPPTKEDDVLRLTYGIETPEIYAGATARASEFAKPRANYLLLLDGKGNNVDNHQKLGDRVYLWREAGSAGASDTLHLWIVGYERIAIVGHLVAPWK